MGKGAIDNCSVSVGIFGFFTEIFIEQSSVFYISFILIDDIDWSW